MLYGYSSPSVSKPLKVPSLARYVLKPFKMLQEGEGEGEGAKRRYTLCNETLLLFADPALYFVPRDSLTLRCRPPTPLVVAVGLPLDSSKVNRRS